MSTTSSIWIKNSDDEFVGIYCNWDGNPSHNGRILKESFTDEEKIRGLIALGNLSALDAEITAPQGHTFETPIKGFSIFYHRDRGEKLSWLKANNEQLLTNQNYNYLFKDGKWFYSNRQSNFKKLTNVAIKADKY